MDIKRKALMYSLIFCLSILLLTSCSNAEEVQHIEVYVTETSEKNDEGRWEKTGYKKINSISTVEKGENYINTDIKAIEDYYDTDGNYIKTEVIHSTFEKSEVTKAESGEDRKEELQEPSTILIPNDPQEHFQLEDMTEEDKERVKEHVLSYIDKL